jgi:hypothetical protein
MNSYGARLNDQELRNAQYSGLFKELSFQLAADFLDTWLAWKLFNTQSVAEMRDAEFVSELLLLFISGTPASPKKALKDAYENWEDQFPRADDAVARFKDVFRMIEEAVGPEGEPLRRLSGKMWMYSLCDALQQIRFGGPIESGGSGKPVPTVRLKGLIDAANAAISAGELPSAVEKATRGAATDPSSRAARSTFLVDLYGP